MLTRWRLAPGAAVLALAACAANPGNGGPAPGSGGAAAGTGTAAMPMPTGTDTLVAAGFGTLRQDEVTVSLRNGAVLVKVTPLDESVIRLLAPDTYERLVSLRNSRRDEARRRAMSEPELFLISFFSYEPDAAFQPEDVQVVYQSRLLRPEVVIPLTDGWGRQRLDQQETQTAIYGFDADIDFQQVFTVRYGMAESDQWRQILVRLENERGRIRSRIR